MHSAVPETEADRGSSSNRQQMSLFSDLLCTPLGPVDDHLDDPLFH
jgi:hypothetical protein